MTVLILYASIEGQTAKIADFIQTLIRDEGHEVRMINAGDPAAEVSLDGIDHVILAASVHERRHPKNFEVLIAAESDALNAHPLLLLSVSLSAAFPEGRAEAQDYATELLMRTGIKPKAQMLVPGAVRTRSYDYYASQVVRHVIMRDRDFDMTAEEHEFTNWHDIKAKVTHFLAA